MKLRDYQSNCVSSVFEEWKTNKSTIAVLPTGCHAKGQGIMMYDGTIKKVEDVLVGDKVMGMASTYQTVTQLARGHGEMVRIVPNTGKPFTVNMDHILTLLSFHLVGTSELVFDMSVREWMGLHRQAKGYTFLFRMPPLESIEISWFKVEPAGTDDYYGFSLDGDGRFLLDDFTVTHNTGKTVAFSHVIRSTFPRRSLVIAHRAELIWQAAEKIRAVTGWDVGIEMGDYHSQNGGLFKSPRVVVATVQTLTAGGDGGGRMSKYLPTDFDTIVIDECHHGISPSYKRVLKYFQQNPNLKVLGVTATPDRADEEALGQIFDTVAFDYEVLDAINDGWLCPIQQQIVGIEGLDYSHCKTTAGDLNGGDLARVMEEEETLQGVADATISIAGSKQTLVFAVSVKQAERLAEIFNRHAPGSTAWVCGETDKDVRRQLLADFSAKKIQRMVNCMCLTEGFDSPSVEYVVMGRATKSRSLYAQMLGRGTRPLPGLVDGLATPEERRNAIAASAKPFCNVIDFAGNSGKHKLASAADVLGGNVSDEIVAKVTEMARKTGKPVTIDQAIKDAEEEEARIREQKRLAEAASRMKLVAKAKFTTKIIDPFDAFQLMPVKARGWDADKSLSDKQRGILQKQGINPDSIPYAQAKQVLNELFRRWNNDLCTLGQAKVLTRYGYDVKEISRSDASKMIDAIAKNGWKKPAA